MNNRNYIVMLVFSCLLFSCKKSEVIDSNFGKTENDSVAHNVWYPPNDSVIHDYRVENVLYAKNAKLKQISRVESVNSQKTGFITSMYEYDELERISKVSNPMYEDGTSMYENGTIVGLVYYDLYVYNDKSQLEKIINYHSYIYSITGFINLKNKIYIYDTDGNKLKVAIDYPLIGQTDSIFCFYDNNRLVREDNFDGSLLRKRVTSYIKYEYNEQCELIKESYYSAEDNTLFQTVVHTYKEGLNVKTEVFNNYYQNDKMGEIRRYYDKNDNLIYLKSMELAVYSSAMSFVSRYEYE